MADGLSPEQRAQRVRDARLDALAMVECAVDHEDGRPDEEVRGRSAALWSALDDDERYHVACWLAGFIAGSLYEGAGTELRAWIAQERIDG